MTQLHHGMEQSTKGAPFVAACIGLGAESCKHFLGLQDFLHEIASVVSILSGLVGFIWMLARFIRWLKEKDT